MSDFYRQQRHIVPSSSPDHYSLAIYVFTPGGQDKVQWCLKGPTYPTDGRVSAIPNIQSTLTASTLLQMDKHGHAPYPFVGPHLAHTFPYYRHLARLIQDLVLVL